MDSTSTWPENANMKRAIQELVHGRQLAHKLQDMLGIRPLIGADELSLKATTPISLSAQQDLVARILGSFTESLFILNSGGHPDEVSQVPTANSLDARKSEDSSESCKPPPVSTKDGRGCYKRRKTSETWTKVTSTWIDDGHAWRKYGQKIILNAEYPRNYFRCTHKFDQGCQASKQVQKIQENPPLYRTTYHGQHTCKRLLKAPQIILDSTASDSSILIGFGSTNPNNGNNYNDSFISILPSIKQENEEDVKISFQNPSSAATDYFLSPDLTTFETSGPMTAALSSGSDHGDVISSELYSCTGSTHSLEMDMMVGSVDDFDDLQLEF